MPGKRDPKVTAPIKGLYRDTAYNSQPENTYTYALNALNISSEGEQNFLANEQGNTVCVTLPEDYILVGAFSLPDNEAILFSAHPSNGRSEIGLLNAYCVYTTLVNSNCLAMDKTSRVQATLNYVNQTERVITLKTPTLYQINIDDLDQYLLSGETQASANADGAGWDCDEMKLFSTYDYACIEDITVNDTGGNLEMGAYEFTCTYMDNNLNEIGWMDFTLPVPIFDDKLTNTYSEIDGGISSIGPVTTKSIDLAITGVDTSFDYLRVAVVATIESVKTAYKVIDLAVNSTDLTCTLSSTNGLEQIDVDALSIPRAIYESAETITQIDNRILLGNLTEKSVDLAVFQQAVNDIQVKWVATELDPAEDTSTESNKSPDYHLDHKSYMHDEVYALGIEFLFKDGYRTPIMHIPARAQNKAADGSSLISSGEYNTYHNRAAATSGWDSSSFSIGSSSLSYEDAAHIASSGSLERWEAYNTAIKDSTPDAGYFASGEMSYWESTIAYPDDVDSSGARIYPTGNVRHHKMPDETLIASHDYDTTNYNYKIYPLGLSFANITVPTEYVDDVVSYKIYRVQRDASNSSVIDKGIFTRMFLQPSSPTLESFYDIFGSRVFQPWPYNGERVSAYTTVAYNKMNAFHGSTTKFQPTSVAPSHIKIDQAISNKLLSSGNVINYHSSSGSDYRSDMKVSTAATPAGIQVPSFTNRLIETQGFVAPDSVLQNGVFDYIVDNTEQQEMFLVQTQDLIPEPAVSETFMTGDTTTSVVYFYYGAIKSYLPQQYGSLESLIYIPVSGCFRDASESSIVEYGGDTFISPMYMRKCSRIATDLPVNGSTIFGVPINHDQSAVGTDSLYRERHLIKYYAPSNINNGLRHEGTAVDQVYWPKSYTSSIDDFLNLELTINGDTNSDLIPNYYAYNTDFSKECDNKVGFPSPVNYNWTNNLENKYRRRVAYSEKQNEDSSITSVKQFLVNNYIDLSGIRGSITNLFVDRDQLYAQTNAGFFKLPTNNQVLTTSEATIYIGNSSFLSLEPLDYAGSDEGYLGSKSQFATKKTDFGTIFVSNDKVFMLTHNGLQEISAIGMRKFFQDNKLIFPTNLIEFFYANGISFTDGYTFPNADNPSNPYGVGYMAAWDRVNNRYILHKRDFEILIEEEDFLGIYYPFITYYEGHIVYNLTNARFEKLNSLGNWEALEFSDSRYFRNRSYTVSFDPKNMHWVSFHSYLPNFMFNTYDRWYSFRSNVNDDSIYRHDNGTFQTFYGDLYPHMIEFITPMNPLNSSISNSLFYTSQARKLNTTYNEWADVELKTFDRAWVYNDTQSSGYLDIVVSNNDPFQTVDYDTDTMYVYKADKTWRGHVKRSTIIDTTLPVGSNRWTDISTVYPIDKIPNPDAHDVTQDPFILPKLRDKYLATRLILDDPEDTKLLTQYMATNNVISIR